MGFDHGAGGATGTAGAGGATGTAPRLRLSIVGTGYLGATHAVCMAELGFDVVLGLDVDDGKIAKLADGEAPFYEPGLEPLLRKGPRLGSTAVHHVVRRGGGLRRCALPLRRHAAEGRRVRRRPQRRGCGDRRPAAAAVPTLPAGRQFRLLCWIRGHDQVIARPGKGGHMPPRSSMARATRASGERNPKAMRVRSRSFVFTLSTRAFDSPWLSAASMPARWSRMERASLTNAGSRQRQAHFSQASSSAIPSAPLS